MFCIKGFVPPEDVYDEGAENEGHGHQFQFVMASPAATRAMPWMTNHPDCEMARPWSMSRFCRGF